jgi:hypothetical protein
MVGSLSRREDAFTDQAPAHVLTDDDEYLADLVGARGVRISPGFVVRGHVDQQ